MSHSFHFFGFHHSDSNNNNNSNINNDNNQHHHHHHHHHHLFHFNRLAPEVEQPKLDEAIKKENASTHTLLPPDVERRNIFRILETVWAFQVSLVPHYKGDSNADGWAAFDDDSQKRLEEAFNNKTTCILSNASSIGAGIIHFESNDHSVNEEEKEEEAGKRVFRYKVDINRMSTPLWRFEKGDGSKQTQCFEWKNQVRLEAFDDPNTTLILTDKAFPNHPFTVVLNQEQKKNGEKWQGFMYLNSSPIMNIASSYNTTEDHYQDVGVQNMEDFPNFNVCDEIEKERLDEERIRDIYSNQKQ